jgi:hypothetical protein
MDLAKGVDPTSLGPNWLRFIGGGSSTDPMQNVANELAIARKYDPNASVTSTARPATYGSEGQVTQQEGFDASVQYDKSKVPQIGGSKFTDAQRQYLMPLSGLKGSGAGAVSLYNPKFVYNDPNYGPITSIQNLNQSKQGSPVMNRMSQIMPVVVKALLAGAFGAALGPVIGQLFFSGATNAAQTGSPLKRPGG